MGLTHLVLLLNKCSAHWENSLSLLWDCELEKTHYNICVKFLCFGSNFLEPILLQLMKIQGLLTEFKTVGIFLVILPNNIGKKKSMNSLLMRLHGSFFIQVSLMTFFCVTRQESGRISNLYFKRTCTNTLERGTVDWIYNFMMTHVLNNSCKRNITISLGRKMFTGFAIFFFFLMTEKSA